MAAGALICLVSAVSPALALTNGQPLTNAFPRIAAWWPADSAPSSVISKLGYVVPSEPQPMQPDAARIAAIRSLNPAAIVLADDNACELRYRQPDSAGNPVGAASYDAELVGAIPTSWLLTQVGSTLSAPINTVTKPQQSITVVDGSKFRAGDLVIIDDEKCLVVSVSGSTLAVRRGWAGSAAVNHAAGTRIASTVSCWPYTVKVDLTDDCPLGRATGQNATPGAQTERARDWMIRRSAAFAEAGDFDGVAVDLSVGYISWFKGTSPYEYRSIASRLNPSVEVNYTDMDAKWAAALKIFQTSLRSDIGDGPVILANEGTPEFGALNGSRLEDFPQSAMSSSYWRERVIGPNKPFYPSYLEWCSSARQPNLTTIQTYGTATNYQLMRYGLTTALMGDGFYAYSPSSGILPRYDEYDNAGAGAGYLGNPIGTMSSAVAPLATPDLLRGCGGFDTAGALSAWSLYSQAGYAAQVSADDGAAKIQVTQSAGSLSGVQLSLPHVPVTAGTHYTLTFRVRADRPMTANAEVQRASAPWTTYMAAYDDKFSVGTEWRTLELPMISSGTDPAAAFHITMAEAVGTLWIDDMKLQVGDRNVYRRDFDHGIALVNPTEQPVYVNLQGTFREIKGTQAPLVNTGGLVAAVTLQPKDGIVLLRAAPGEVVPMPSAVTRPAGVAKIKVRRKLTLTGTVAPADAPGVVTIVKTRLVGRHWRSAGSASVSVVNGSYRYSFTPRSKGLWHFAARYSGTWNGTTGYAAAKSTIKSVRVQ